MWSILKQILDLTKEPEPEVTVTKKQNAVDINVNISVKDYSGDLSALCKSIRNKFRKDKSNGKPRKPPTGIEIVGRTRKPRIGPTN
jgi:hypothetical protein